MVKIDMKTINNLFQNTVQFIGNIGKYEGGVIVIVEGKRLGGVVTIIHKLHFFQLILKTNLYS